MDRKTFSSWAAALALSPAFWLLAGERPAMAHPSGDPACYQPPFSLLISPCVPHDVPASPPSTTSSPAILRLFAANSPWP